MGRITNNILCTVPLEQFHGKSIIIFFCNRTFSKLVQDSSDQGFELPVIESTICNKSNSCKDRPHSWPFAAQLLSNHEEKSP